MRIEEGEGGKGDGGRTTNGGDPTRLLGLYPVPVPTLVTVIMLTTTRTVDKYIQVKSERGVREWIVLVYWQSDIITCHRDRVPEEKQTRG